MYKGLAISPGVSVGVAVRVEPLFATAERRPIPPGTDPAAEVGRFEEAVELAAHDLRELIATVTEQVGAAEAAIFQAHLALVTDPGLARKVRELIESEQVTALSALQSVLQDTITALARLESDHLRERIADIRDVLTRIGTHLTGFSLAKFVAENATDDPPILIARELLPSHAVGLGEVPLGGIVTEVGGATSHAAILSRSRGIPAVSGVGGILDDVRTGDLIALDGRDGTVVVRPDPETASVFRKLQREFFRLKDRLVLNRDQPAVSADGAPVELLANVSGPADAHAAAAVGASGVGLFRTEYLFIAHPGVPDEDEQYEHYVRVIEESPGRSAVIRTLDLGGDKTVPYLGQRDETNPFMGWRSIRLVREHPRLFEQQIRAILRAGLHGKVSMLIPMITTLEELRYVNEMVKQVKRDLGRDGIPHAEDVPCGVMVEVPAAALCIDAIIRETDFVSIGSNDLVQYLAAADRDNAKVAHLCEPLSPAPLRIIQMVLQACLRSAVPVTVCGEMAGQPRAVLALFGMGLRRFSMSPAFIPTVKQLLGQVTATQAERFAHQILQMKTAGEIRGYLTDRLREIAPDLAVFD